MQQIDEVLGAVGPLARHLPGFAPRRAQIRMAEAVSSALQARRPLLVEAGTGTGKTFAYLVPALLAGTRVLVSTGTRTLQDQLFSKDVPLVVGALGAPARIALLKGRSNYLCRERLKRETAQRTLEGTSTTGPAAAREALLQRLEAWAAVTTSGDLAEVEGFTEQHALWPQVTSTRDNCLGVRCPEYAACHVVAARRDAQAADLVIVNHHLLLADLALKEEGFGDLLGSAEAIILDEAHGLPDLVTQFFGTEVSTRSIERLLTEARAQGGPSSRALEAAVSAVLTTMPRAGFRGRWEEVSADLESAMLALAAALREFSGVVAESSEEPAIVAVAARAVSLAAALETIALAPDEQGVRTVDAQGRSVTLGLLPFDISERFRALIDAHRAAWIFTSATLSVPSSEGDDFSHFASRLGLGDAQSLRIASPFDYETQAMLYLPRGLPEPAQPQYVEAVIEACIPLLEAAGGGAFLLFTSHRALAQGAAALRARWDGAALLPVLVQGEGPREKLLRDFREHGNAVLLGTASFWEGVDVKGEALRLVIIEKLPFASPDDPLTKARIEHLNRRGANAFRDFQLPEAVLALKQGVGRLIRSEDDRGMIVICDPRLLGKGYGRMFRASLPEMPTTQEREDAVRFLRKLRT